MTRNKRRPSDDLSLEGLSISKRKVDGTFSVKLSAHNERIHHICPLVFSLAKKCMEYGIRFKMVALNQSVIEFKTACTNILKADLGKKYPGNPMSVELTRIVYGIQRVRSEISGWIGGFPTTSHKHPIIEEARVIQALCSTILSSMALSDLKLEYGMVPMASNKRSR